MIGSAFETAAWHHGEDGGDIDRSWRGNALFPDGDLELFGSSEKRSNEDAGTDCAILSREASISKICVSISATDISVSVG